MALRQLQSLVSGLDKNRVKSRKQKQRLNNRRALTERLEDRKMLAGPELIAIRPDAGALLRDGDTLTTAPSEFNLLFQGGANLRESTINSNTVRLIRSGGDGVFNDGNDVATALGYVGLVNPLDTDPGNLQRIVLRPASSASFNSKSAFNQFPDDTYQIQIVGAGVTPLTDLAGEAFNSGNNLVTTFRLDRGAQIVSVVPQPITRTGTVLSQARNQIDVSFDNQRLVQADAQNVNFYRLYNAVTLAAASVPTPTNVVYNPTTNSARLTFAADIPEGSYRLDIGQATDSNLVVDNRGALGTSDASISFDSAISLGTINVGASADATLRISGRIERQSQVLLPPLPGGEDDPGHRQIQRESHFLGAVVTGTTPVIPTPIRVIQYHFPLVLGTFDSGDPLNPGVYGNFITETEKQIVRDILEIYAKETGIEFVEGLAGGGLSIGKGDLRALNPATGPNSGVAGLGGPGRVVVNSTVFPDSGRFYGDGFTGVMYHEVGHALSLGHAYDQPARQGAGPVPNEVLTGDNDFLHLKRISPPNSTDIDAYSFTLPSPGRLSAEVFAERLTVPSLLNSALALFKVDAATGNRTLVARNDQYFGADAFLDLDLEAGSYFLGISSAGNTSYDLNVPNSGFGGTTDGAYELAVKFKPLATTELRDVSGTAIDGDADGKAGGVFQFWFQSATPANTFIIDKLADTSSANTNQGSGTLASPFESIRQGLAAAAARVGTSVTSPTIVRIVGNGGTDNNLTTLNDNRPYLIGTTPGGSTLADGGDFRVPAGVNVIIDAGTLIKLRAANIDAGSSSAGVSRAGGSIQVLGTPTHSVFLRSYFDDTAGGNSDGLVQTPVSGDFGGIVFRDDSDREANGIFLNYVNHADIKHGGGKVFVDSIELPYTSIHITNARPTLSFNLIANGNTAAISASPDSFDDSVRRIGPDIHGNYLVSNSINGLSVRIDTPSGAGLTKLQVSGRFDDQDITHVLSENLIIAGGSGGPTRDAFGTLTARPAGRLQIDPGVVVKLNKARIEAERGAGSLIAEGTVDRPIVFTSQTDKRYGGSGSFDTNSSPTSVPAPGNWGGLFFGEATSGSIDHAIITYGGGNSAIEGSDFAFNTIEIHQADVRIANSSLLDNTASAANSNSRRNGRGSNGIATIYVRGAQPVIVNNVFKDNIGTPISINANSLVADILPDYGRSTGPADAFDAFADNYGPLIRLNRLENNGVFNGGSANGMLVRGEEVTVESVWDDTDIVHILQNEVIVDNLHSLGGLTLQSSNSESLVVKLFGPTAGFTATGTPVEIIDRIGGTIHVLGTIGHPVVFTSLNDDSVGAGFTPSGLPNRNTDNSALPTTGAAGDWRGFLFNEFSNDRNVAIIREFENPLTNKVSVNSIPSIAQNLGVLAPNLIAVEPTSDQKKGDENRRLGFEVHGFISPDDDRDVDMYSFTAAVGTPIWVDIDRTDSTLDAIVEIIDANGNVVVGSSAPGVFTGTGAETLTQNTLLGGDYYTQNYRDPGFYYVLTQPGLPDGSDATFFVRVRSNSVVPAGNAQSRGKYMLQIRTQQVDQFPGSTVRFSDIRFATTGIDVHGVPSHSPMIGEAGEVASANDSFGTAQTLVNLLQTDVAAIGLSGSLGSDTDVDWYQFDLNQTGVQVIGGFNDGAGTIAVVFDLDYADGTVSADTTVAVYDQNQRLVYIGRESDVEDDQPDPFALQPSVGVSDLTRGSFGKKDSYIGPIHLTPGTTGQRYFVAVMSNRNHPSALNGVFQSNVSPETARVRLEPVNSVTRIVEDHIGFIGYNSNGVTISPTTGALFDLTNPNAEIQSLSLRDVGLYVATDVIGNTGTAGANDSLYTYNPFTGGRYLTRVSTDISSGGSGFDDVQDIVVRSDGRMFGYQRQIPNQPLTQPNFSIPDRVGQLVEIDPASGQVIAGSATDDNIAGPVIGTAGLTVPNSATLNRNIGSHSQRANEFTLSDEVDAFTFERRDQTGPANAPVPVYDTYFSVRESSTASRLYRGNQDGNAAPGAAGANPNYGVIGDIQPAGVTFATQTLSLRQPVTNSPPNISNIQIKSRDAGVAGNFTLAFTARPNNLNVTVNTTTPFDPATGLTTRLITLTIGATVDTNGLITGAPSTAAIVHAINSNSVAKTWVTAIIAGGNQGANNDDGVDGTPAFSFTPNVTTPVVGSDGPNSYGPLRGRVTGLAFGGYAANGNHTGPLYGVTNAGELITIDQNTGVVTGVILESGNVFGQANLDFQGLTLGPQNVEGGKYKNTLFAVTGNGDVVAFNTATQLNDRVFDTNVVTQTITVAGGNPANIGYFTITSDANGGTRFTTVPIAHNAPPTLSVNESQTVDTTGYPSVSAGLQSTFTLSLVDDQGAITSPSNFVSAGAPQLFVESTAGFPAAPFVIQVDNEQMLVNSVAGNVFDVTRGRNGTAAVVHNDTATVFEVVDTRLASPIGVPTGSTVAVNLDNVSNTLFVNSVAPFAAGQTIRVHNEEMFVTAVNVGPNRLSVIRGQGGTAITHHNVTSPAPASVATAVTIVSQTLNVLDATPLRLASRLRISNEDMRIVSVNTGANTVDVVRGINGTATAAHVVNDRIFKVDTTAAIDVNATFTQVQNAIEALPSVGFGNVVVTGGPLSGDSLDTDQVAGTPNPETIEFIGALKGKNLQPLTADRTRLVGDEIQTISLDTRINHGVFRLDFGPNTTADLPFSATAAQVQAALELLPTIGIGNVVVAGNPLPGGPLTVQFVNELQDQDVRQIVVDRGAFVPYEVQTVTLPGTPISGSYQLTVNDTVNNVIVTSTAIPFDATAAQVQAAIIGGTRPFGAVVLSASNVLVTGGPSPTTPFTIQFIGNLAGRNIAPFRVAEDSNTLAPVTDNTVLLATRAIPPNTIQTLDFSINTPVSSGSFTLTLTDRNVGTGTTGTIFFNDSNATILNRLTAALPSLTGNVTVTGGPLQSAPVFIEFINELAGLQIATMTVTTGAPIFPFGTTLVNVQSQAPVTGPRNEIQSVSVPAGTVSGDFRLSINDVANGITGTSNPIPFDADAATVLAALTATIPAFVNGSVTNIVVGGGPINVRPVTIEFTRGLSRREIAPFTISANNLSPAATPTVNEDQKFLNPLAQNEIQQIAIVGANATAGGFTLSLNDTTNQLIGTTAQIPYTANANTVQSALLATFPQLLGQILVSGGPLSQTNVNFTPITIEFVSDFGGLDIALFTTADAFTPAGASIDVTVPQNNVPQTPTIATSRNGKAVLAPITQVTDGLLSVFDALDGLPSLDVTNFRVAGDLQNPGATVSFIGALAGTAVSNFALNNFLMTNVPPFVSTTPPPYNATNTTRATLSNVTGLNDGLADSPIMTISGYAAAPNQGNQRPIGIAFSPLDFSLWHPTTRRANNVGHGINTVDDTSRTPGNPDVDYATDGVNADRRFKESSGGVSLYFGLEPWLQNEQIGSESYLTYTAGVNAQLGILSTATHQDLSSNAGLVTGVGATGTGSYNLPGGASGSMKSKPFDLSGTIATDRPTLYFSYFLETENHPGSTVNSDVSNPFRDSARVWASRDGLPANNPNKRWELLATNNSQLSNPNPTNAPGTAELGGFLSHLSDAGLNSVPPRPVTQQIRQELFDNTGLWRQARIDLSTFAGVADVQLRFDFSTSGAMNDPTLGTIDSQFGEFSPAASATQRSIRSLANNFEGFYIDDIMVGFAERGEMVTGTGGDAGITDLNAFDRTRNQAPNLGADVLAGPYQLEIRRTGEYQLYDPSTELTIVGVTFDTNDRHIINLNQVDRVDFESGVFPSNVPVDLTQISAIIPPGSLPPPASIPAWSATNSRPETGAMSLESGDVSAIPASVYQVTTSQLGGSLAAGVIEFSFSVDSSEDLADSDGLYFLIDGLPQNLVAVDPDFPASSNPRLAKGALGYQTVRFTVPSGDHTFTWLYDARDTFSGSAFIDNIVLLEGGTGLLADSNRERPQGQFIVESNFITDSLVHGINVQPGTPQGSGGGVPHPGSLINFPQTNSERLIPGIVISNNVVAGAATGIRFAGETNSDPQRPVTFGRIINNTLVGLNRTGTGIQIDGIASPTLLNNLFTDLATSINNASTAAANGSEAPIIRASFFQKNANNPTLGTGFIDAGNSGSPFVDVANRNYYLVSGSPAVDSAQSNEQDRANYTTFKIELGIPESAIIAPDRDVYGQLRVDSSGSTSGGGSSVFIDRGAVDRSDTKKPFAVLRNPVDNDTQDRDPNETVVYLTDPVLENFQILLGDGSGPNFPFEGTGINGLTVNDPADPTVAASAITVIHDGTSLVQGIDYTLGYNALTGVLLLTPLSTLWDPTGVYTIILANTQIADLAGNLLRSNQTDATTKFFILMPDVRLDYGDAPDSFRTLLASNAARHTIQPGATPRLGLTIDSESDGVTPPSEDDTRQTVNATSQFPLFTTTATPTGYQIDVTSAVTAVGGERVTVQIGSNAATFELVATGFAAQPGNVAVPLLVTDTTDIITARLAAAIRNELVLVGNAAVVTSIGARITIQTFDDEDGVGVGTYTASTNPLALPPPFIVFLKDGRTSPTLNADDVLGFLNPSDINGTDISITASSPGKLNAWIDFNGNGAFDPLEQIFNNLDLNVGANPLRIVTPPSTPSGTRWARFRISENGDLGPNELAIGGEVEDYLVQIIDVAPTVPVNDAFSVNEDQVLNTAALDPMGNPYDTVFSNDSPTGFLPPRFMIETGPALGTLDPNIDPLSGRFIYTPPADFYGQVSFTYWVSTQPQPGTIRPANVSLATVFINIAPVNDVPSATNKSFATLEDTELSISPGQLTFGAIGDANPQYPSPIATAPWNEAQQTFQVTSLTIAGTPVNTTRTDVPGTNGKFDVSFSGGVLTNLIFKPNQDFNRDNPPNVGLGTFETFAFTIRDSGESVINTTTGATLQGTPQFVTATASITVVPRNDVPTAGTDLVTIGPVGTTVPLANPWKAYFDGLGQPVRIPTEDTNLVIPAAFLLSNDSAGSTDAMDENSFVNGNDAPLRIISATVNNRDAAVSIDASGNINLTPPTNVYGDVVITYVVEDRGIDEETNGTRTELRRTTTGTITVTLQPVNDPPVTYPRTFAFTESANPGVDSPAHAFTASQLLNGSGAELPSAPGLFASDLPAPFNESEQLSSLRVASFTTSRGTVTNDVASLGATGTGTLLLGSNAGGTFEFDFVNFAFTNGRFLPAADYNQRFTVGETFAFAVEDNGATTDPQLGNTVTLQRARGSATATILVAPTNDAPAFSIRLNSNGQPAFDILERDDLGGTSIAGAIANITPGPATALDELSPRQFVSFALVNVPGVTNIPAGLMAAPPTIADDGTLVIFPAKDQVGSAVYVFDATDREPGTSGFVPRTTRGTFTINVRPVNDAPQFIAGADVNVPEDSGPYNSSTAYATSIVPGPADEIADGQTVSFNVTTPIASQSLFSVLPSISPTGFLTFTPAANAVGSAVINVIAIDNLNAATTPISLTITITEVNDAPVAGDFETTIDEDNTAFIVATNFFDLAVDPDFATNTNERLQITQLATSSAFGATISFNSAGEVVYDPTFAAMIQALKPNQTASDTFTYRLADAANAVSNEATVTVTVSGINDAPVANDDPVILLTGPSTLNPLANDTDIDGTIQPDLLIVTQQPTNGSLSIRPDGTLIYTPRSGFRGIDIIRYTVGDDRLQQSEQATITLDVAPLPAPPDVSTGSFMGEPATIDLTAADVPVGTLDFTSVVIVRDPANGTVTIQVDGTIIYQSDPGFVGTDSFDYTIADMDGRVSDPVTVTVRTTGSRLQNPQAITDVNASGRTTALDALLIINRITRGIRLGEPTPILVQSTDRGPHFYDVNGDGKITGADALTVINTITRESRLRTSGEGESDNIQFTLLAAPDIDPAAFLSSVSSSAESVSSELDKTFDIAEVAADTLGQNDDSLELLAWNASHQDDEDVRKADQLEAFNAAWGDFSKM